MTALRAPGRRARVVVALIAGACVAPAALTAAPLAPADLSAAGGSSTGPRVGMSGGGGVLVVWQDAADGRSRVEAVVRNPGGTFSSPVVVSRPGDEAAAPQVAVAASGAAVVVWRRTGTGGTGIQAATRRGPSDPLSEPVDLSPAGAQAFSPQVAIAPSGAAVVTWLRFDGANTVVDAVTRGPGGAFSAPVQLSITGRDALAPHAAIDGSGRAVVAWNRSNGANTVIQAAAGSAADFGAPVDLSAPGEDAFGAQVALDPSTGTGVVAWMRPVGDAVVVQAATRSAGGAFSAPFALSEGGADATQPQVAVSAGGGAVAVWRRAVGRDQRVQASIRPPGGSFGPGVDLSAPGADALDPRLAMDPSGRAVVTWWRSDASDPRIQAVTRAGGAFSAPADVSERGTVTAEPRAALDGAGNAVVVWRRADRQDDIVQAAGIDEAGPVVGDVALPAVAVAGRPVDFGASARDVWSALAPGPVWTFGDGAGAVGTRVTHVFAEPGTYAVRVAQADALGNVGVAERLVVVSPGAAGGGAGAGPGPVTGLRLDSSDGRRPIALYAHLGVVRRGARVHLRVHGRASTALAGRRAVVERRVGRRARTLCVVRIRPSGAFHRLCRVDRLIRGRALTLRVRVRIGATSTTRAAALPYVTRKILRPKLTGAGRSAPRR